MLVRGSNGSYEFIDFRETAPAAAFQDMYNNNTNASIFGGLARYGQNAKCSIDIVTDSSRRSGIPGEVRGLSHLHQNYGVLPWKTVMQPAIDTARNGWNVNVDLVKYMKAATARQQDFLSQNPTWALDFAPNGTRVGLGDIMTRRRYADTLDAIAHRGPEAFYTGPIAETMINTLQRENGIMTLEDLRNYTVAIRKPSQIEYRGYRITSCSAPSSGEVALAALKTVEGYSDFFSQTNIKLSTHRLDEAIRFAYGQRAQLGDPLFVPGLDRFQQQMLSAETAAEVRGKISDYDTLNVSAYAPSGFESLDTPGTSHIVAADQSGMAVSFTTTVNLLFGSQLMVPETGIIMNNEMNDFSIPGSSNAFGYVPSPSNYIRPGKRPLSSISPTIAEFANGTLYFVIGAAGGSRIITSTIQNLVNVLDRNLTVSQALAQPRFHDQLIPNQISFEYAYDNETVAFMQTRGHNVTRIAPGQSSAQGLRRLPNGTFEAAGEPRLQNSGGFAT